MGSNKSRDRATECSMQFTRTVARTGKWRGKKADEYVKYQKRKVNKFKERESTKEYIQGLRKKYGDTKNTASLIARDLTVFLHNIIKDQAKRPY